jgi:hypothetical protein
MNKLAQAIALALGSFGLFSGAFVGFAHLRGTPSYRLPLIGSFFTAPAAAEVVRVERTAAEPAAEPAVRPAHESSRAGLGLLDMFRIESPLQAAEMQELARSLKAALARVEEREELLDEREERLDERALFLEEQVDSIAGLREELESWERELELRQAEVERDEAAWAEREAESWRGMARLFEKGEAASLARRLEAWSPQEAAQLLRHLEPERARELLEALRVESWKEYWEAYRQALSEERP